MIEPGDLIRINHLLERWDQLDDLTATLTDDDGHHARTQRQSRQAAHTTKLLDALRRAHGVASPDDADLWRATTNRSSLDSRLEFWLPTRAGLR